MFYHQTVTTPQIVDYINQQSGLNLTPVFDQYLRYINIPTLNLKFENGKVYAKWTADVKNFNMPIKVRTKGGEYQFIKPTTTYTPVNIPSATKDNLEVDTLEFYVKVDKGA
jgi:aminopeptidase N